MMNGFARFFLCSGLVSGKRFVPQWTQYWLFARFMPLHFEQGLSWSAKLVPQWTQYWLSA